MSDTLTVDVVDAKGEKAGQAELPADDFDVQRDHVRLLRAAMARLAPGGLLLFSNNFRRFKLADEVATFASVREISADTIDPDFERNPRIHRAWELRAP